MRTLGDRNVCMYVCDTYASCKSRTLKGHARIISFKLKKLIIMEGKMVI